MSENKELKECEQSREPDRDVAIQKLLITGNLAGLSESQKTQYALRVCEHLEIDPSTWPFQFINFKGIVQLYAKKSCTDQLRKRDSVSIRILEEGIVGDHLYRVKAMASIVDQHGRERVDADFGVVSLKGLTSEDAANAIKKAVTQAKRRVTLSICGLGMLDESEFDFSPGPIARPEPQPEPEPKQLPQKPSTNGKPDASTAWKKAGDEIDRLQQALGIPTEAMRKRLVQKYGTSDLWELTAEQLKEIIVALSKAVEAKGAKK